MPELSSRECQLFSVGFPFSLQFLGVNNIKSPFLVAKIIGQSRMNLGRSQVAKAVKNLIDAHAELIIPGNAVDGNPCPRDDWPSPGDPWI